MLFNSIEYGLFFLLVFAVHWILPLGWRRPFLLLASYYFYASAIPQYIVLILGLTAFNYAMGFAVHRTRGRQRNLALMVAIAGNLGSLAYFKYTGLIVQSVTPLLARLPLMGPLFHDPLAVNILLPLGISFFTFEFIHYNVEVFKGLPPMRSPVDFALFAAFFPTQIAGPIKRFPDFVKQLEHPLPLREVDFDGGVGLILRGLMKKVLVADVLAPVVAEAFKTPGTLGPGAAWFAVLAFATQIYCDFSGYTDMGRGSAMLLGYSVPENFESPYQSTNPAEFWHRWHMSLSSWLRDYLYIPLGGSRRSEPLVYRNLMITMALGGLWHGASWHFMVWGIYEGVLLCGHRLWSRTMGRREGYKAAMSHPLLAFWSRPLTLILVCVGWVFFRANSLPDAFGMFGSMLAFGRAPFAGLPLRLTETPVLLVLGAGAVVIGGWIWTVFGSYAKRVPGLAAQAWDAAWMRGAYAVAGRPALFSLAVIILVLWPTHAGQRFIYFQF